MSDSTLKLHVNGENGGPSPYDVVARVQPVGQSSSSRTAFDTVVPSGATQGWDVAVDAGTWIVQLLLADGRVLQRACDVDPGQTVPIFFEERSSRGAAFSLQGASGESSLADLLAAAVAGRRPSASTPATVSRGAKNARGISGRSAKVSILETIPAGSKTRSVATTRGTAGIGLGRQVQAAAGPRRGKGATGAKRVGSSAAQRDGVLGRSGSTGAMRVGSSARGIPSNSHVATVRDGPKRRAEPRNAPEAITLALSSRGTLRGSDSWATLAAGPEAWTRSQWSPVPADQSHADASAWRLAPDVAGSRAGEDRVWGLVTTAKALEAVSIPAPWNSADGTGTARIDLLVDGTLDGRACTSLAINDRQLNGLLSYLDQGALSSARPILQQLDRYGGIERTIDEKRRNPLAACAAAYVGLAVYSSGEQERWDSWLPNIIRMFPAIPDGAVVHARRILLRPKNDDESDQLLAVLEQAFAAGVPYFSAGLLLMRDMLELLVPSQTRAEALLAQVAPVVARCDPRRMFTTLRYPDARR